MSVNKHRPHVFVIPEDDANRQVALGFVLHDQIDERRIQLLSCAGGWSAVLKKFETEYVQHLRKYLNGHVVMLIDFDGRYPGRRKEFRQAIPADIQDRVFVVGALETPEILKHALNANYEKIGVSLARDCFNDTTKIWGHDHLKHNEPDRLLLFQVARQIVFRSLDVPDAI